MTDKWYDKSPGWLLIYEEAFLEGLARTLKESARIVNIGSGAGTSSCAIMRGISHLEDAYVFSVDVENCPQEIEALVEQGLYNLDIFEQIRGKSWDVWRLFGIELDMVFIDGSHGYLGTYNDLQIYSRILKPGGLLVCHDYRDPGRRSVTRAVNQWKKDNQWLLVGQVLYTVAYMKPGGPTDWATGRVDYE